MYNANKPLAGGLSYNPADIYNALHEARVAEYNAQQDAIMREQANAQREIDSLNESYARYITEAYVDDQKRIQYLNNVKSSFVTECLYKLFKESCVAPLTKQDEVYARNMITRFVKENGASSLIFDFQMNRNYIMSEFGRICDKYYNKVLEGHEKTPETDELGYVIGHPVKLDNTVGTEFFEELEDVDCSDACKLIKDRVADAIAEFIDSNIAARMEYQELINAAKDQIDKVENEAFAEDIANRSRRDIIEAEASRKKNVYHCIVESLTKSVIKNEDLHAKYVNEAKIDMETITNTAQLMYTMLEMCNTVELVKIDEAFIKDYLTQLSK